MAAERAATMATQIQPSVRSGGIPLAAMTAPVSPKGSVRNECSHLIISSVTRVVKDVMKNAMKSVIGHGMKTGYGVIVSGGRKVLHLALRAVI